MVVMTHWVYVCSFFWRELLMFRPPSQCGVSPACSTCSFPDSWGQTNFTTITKDQYSSSVTDYQPISITPVLSKVFERGINPSRMIYGTQWSAFSHQVCLSKRSGYHLHVMYSVSPMHSKWIGEWAGGLDYVDCFSAAFDMVNNQGILNKLCSVGIEGSVLSLLIRFYQWDHSWFWWTVRSVFVWWTPSSGGRWEASGGRWEARSASQRLGVMRKSWRVFNERLLLERCVLDFFLPV